MPQLVTIFNVISVFLYAVIDVIVKYMVNCYQEASTSCYSVPAMGEKSEFTDSYLH